MSMARRPVRLNRLAMGWLLLIWAALPRATLVPSLPRGRQGFQSVSFWTPRTELGSVGGRAAFECVAELVAQPLELSPRQRLVQRAAYHPIIARRDGDEMAQRDTQLS